MATVLVTGANRGIGLALVRQFQERGDNVLAVCRHTSDDLKGLNVQVFDNVDVTKDKDVEKLAEHLKGQSIDILVNNAGLLVGDSLESFNFDEIRRQFEVNTLGPLRVTRALLPNLKSGSKLGLVTSRMGSIADNNSGGQYGYRISKTALNAVGMSLAHDLKGKGVAVALLHPGYVRTEMTHHSGHIEPEEAARGIIARLDELSIEKTGGFWHSNGEPLPW